jgi:chorismate-pyruvate lyase
MKASGKPDPALARRPIGRLTETRNIQTAGESFFTVRHDIAALKYSRNALKTAAKLPLVLPR